MRVCAIIAGCILATVPAVAQELQQPSRIRPPVPRVAASYSTSDEMTYTLIEVKNDKLRYTYNKRNSLAKPGELLMRSQPYYTKQDLVTEEAALSATELSSLADLVRKSGFLRLRETYNDRPRERVYAETATASLDGKGKRVVLLHSPAPKAFHDVVHRLIFLVNGKLKKRLPNR